MAQKLVHYAVTHGGIRKLLHPRLNTEIDNQTAVKYLRFIQPVKVDTLELPRSVYGRWSKKWIYPTTRALPAKACTKI
jgi:hypothetical protein